MIDIVREFIKTCPYLPELEDGIRKISVDYLEEAAETYVIETVPVDPVVQAYTDGSMDKQFGFILASKEYYGRDAMMNIENLGFYEQFASWLEQKTRMRQFPALEDGRQILSIQADLTPFLFDIDPEMDMARYQIQCVMQYYEPRIPIEDY